MTKSALTAEASEIAGWGTLSFMGWFHGLLSEDERRSLAADQAILRALRDRALAADSAAAFVDRCVAEYRRRD